MTIQVWALTPGGALEKKDLVQAPASLDDVTTVLPGGAYTTFCTCGQGQKVTGLHNHLARLEESARGAAALAGLDLDRGIFDQGRLRGALRQLLSEAGYTGLAEARVRLSLDLQTQPGMFYFALQPLQALPSEVYQFGVHTSSSPLKRANPALKQTSFISESRLTRQQMPSGIFELLLLDDHGAVLEGMTSNFYAVRAGRVHTAGEGILAGVTRRVLLEILTAENIPVIFEPVRLSETASLNEAFLTSSSRGVVPITAIDGQTVGSGQPGPLSRRLGVLYNQWVDAHAETI